MSKLNCKSHKRESLLESIILFQKGCVRSKTPCTNKFNSYWSPVLILISQFYVVFTENVPLPKYFHYNMVEYNQGKLQHLIVSPIICKLFVIWWLCFHFCCSWV